MRRDIEELTRREERLKKEIMEAQMKIEVQNAILANMEKDKDNQKK